MSERDPETLKNAQMLVPPFAHVTFSQKKRKLLIFRKRFEEGGEWEDPFLNKNFSFLIK